MNPIPSIDPMEMSQADFVAVEAHWPIGAQLTPEVVENIGPTNWTAFLFVRDLLAFELQREDNHIASTCAGHVLMGHLIFAVRNGAAARQLITPRIAALELLRDHLGVSWFDRAEMIWRVHYGPPGFNSFLNAFDRSTNEPDFTAPIKLMADMNAAMHRAIAARIALAHAQRRQHA